MGRWRRSTKPIRGLPRSWPKPGGRRCGGGPTASPGSPQSSFRSSFRRRAPARFGRGSPRPSIRSIRRPIIEARAPKLARIGLSRPKIKALKEIARAVARGKLALASLADIPADDAHAALTAVHGIGPWTADIYLIVLPRPCRCLAGGRSRVARSGAACLRLARAAERQGHDAARRTVAAAARRGGAGAVDLLSRRQRP